MIWDRRSMEESGPPQREHADPFTEVLADAPVIALLLDPDDRVIRANKAARQFFSIDEARLPASIVEATLESRLFQLVISDVKAEEVQLVHRRRTVAATIAPGRRVGERILFLVDMTELRRLGTVRQEFVANLVHELKTPITSLRLAAESLTGEPPAVDRRRFAERIVREADLISKIIDNLRQLGDIEAGATTGEVVTFDLIELVRETVGRLGLQRQVNISGPAALRISADRTKLAQAMGNVLDNAAKFSPPATEIDVEIETGDGDLVIGVRDRGPGISPEHWSRVFERFYKVDSARPREAGGFGLGLAITKHLVQVMGGRIWTEAARDGGQVFSIALPREVLTGA